MNLNISKYFYKAGLQLKKHSPEILVVTGAIGVVTSAVMACKATRKIDDILDEAKKDVDVIHECSTNENFKDKYSEEDAKKDLIITYSRAAIKFAKLYGPSVALGALSLGCIFASNNILRKRGIAIAAAYTAIDTTFKEYRKRVVERFGEEVDRELKYNLKAKKATKKVVDEETGETKTVKKTEYTAEDPTGYSDYARFFDEYCNCWEKDPEYNLMFLRTQQSYANDLLKSRGHLFLNEVYDMLGIPRTKAGQVVGWVYNEDNPVGDNFVDFGIYDINRETNRDFVNGYERSILLDFNVDGNIWDLI